MKVGVYYSNSDVRLEGRSIPGIGSGEILMQVEACGICGSDVLEWYRIKKAPLVLGHELVGIVREKGAGVDRFDVGDRIAVNHHVPCNECRFCLSGHHTMCETLQRKTNVDPGGFAEYCRVPAINVDRGVFKVPEGLSFEEATFAEPLGCVLRGQRVAGVRSGQKVLVLGSGVAGLLHVMAARAAGASFVAATDVSPYRLQTARDLGADVVIDARADVPARFQEAAGQLADVAILCAGPESAARQAMASVDRGGTVLFFASTDPGVTVPLSIEQFFWRRDTTLTTTYANSPEDFQQALALLHSRRIDVRPMITHRYSLDDVGAAFATAAAGRQSMKVIVYPHGH